MADGRRTTPIEIGLTAAIVAVEADEPHILVVRRSRRARSAPACRSARSIRSRTAPSRSACAPGCRRRPRSTSAMSSSSTRSATAAATRGRATPAPHVVSVGYLALTRMSDNAAALRAAGAGFEPWYRFFPWEDWRDGRPAILDDAILPAARAMGAERQGRSRAAAGPARAAAALLRRRRLAVGRGEGARPLRAALRGRPGRGGAARRPRGQRARARSCRRSASRCASITAAFSRPRSRGCAPS